MSSPATRLRFRAVDFTRAARSPRLVGAAAAVCLCALSVGLLLGLGVPTHSAPGADAGLAAALLAASPSPIPATASPTPEPTPTPPPTYAVMTPRTLTPPDQLTGYVWPLAGGRITLPFGPTSWGEMVVDGQLFHDGVDITTACGDRVLAAHDGVVLAAGRQYDDYVGWVGDIQPYYDWLTRHNYWNSLPIVVVIDDGDGYRSIYAHESRVTVVPGQVVKAGDTIGIEGMTGNASGCHVHFGLFSPLEAKTFELEPDIAARDSLPHQEIARIDPLLVLPFRCDVSEQVALRPAEASACPPPTKRPVTPTKKPTATSASSKASGAASHTAAPPTPTETSGGSTG